VAALGLRYRWGISLPEVQTQNEVKVSNGWGAKILGRPKDLSQWAASLKPPDDPWVEVHRGEHVLRAQSLDESGSAGEVKGRAVAQIERLNGAMALFSAGAEPVKFAGVIEFRDGALHETMFVEHGEIILSGTSFFSATATGGSAAPPGPSEVQQWMSIADGDDLLEDALIYFGRATDWFDIYKTLECLILKFGAGNEEKFIGLDWAPAASVRLLKRTANWARHARQKFDPPPNPMPLKEARQLLAQLVRRALS
jgi:hypothetical protein